jgi:hypothetical protein
MQTPRNGLLWHIVLPQKKAPQVSQGFKSEERELA